MNNYNEQYKYYLDIVERELNNTFNTLADCPSVLKDSMEYAVMGGGKRIRPVLCLAISEMLGVKIKDVINFALAIEFIHSYSLVHDDLPAMDDDDYRRGKYSTHKKFGEAYGILCGDALLNFAFELALKKENFSNKDADCLRVIADYAGYNGMIKGQVLDLQNEKNNNATEVDLMNIYKNKTSKLLTLPLLIASIQADNKYYNELLEYGTLMGIMFQITDDIMDVEGTAELIGKTPHKDETEDKLTGIKIYGIKKAKAKNKELFNRCMEICDKIPDSDFLKEFTINMFRRKK